MLKNPTLLVITENPPIRYWIKKHLESQFSIIDAHSENKAIETVKTSHLDFVILDGSFEACDPIELSAKIRNIAPHMAFPILLITGRLKKTYRDSALDSGVTDFLSDQLDVDELQAKISTGKKTTQVRQKVSGLSNLIAAPIITESTRPLTVQFLNQSNALLILQIDQFQSLSNRDEVLQKFHEFLKGEQHEVTYAEEGRFVIQLQDYAQSQKTAEALQKKIKEHFFHTKQGPIQLTASFAISKVDKESFTKTIDAATSALKQSSQKKNTIFSLDQEFLG